MASKSHHALRRRYVAQENAEKRSNRTNEQQLALIKKRRGNSTKETTRLSS